MAYSFIHPTMPKTAVCCLPEDLPLYLARHPELPQTGWNKVTYGYDHKPVKYEQVN